MKPVRILAIESSCDETSVAVVENGRRILSNVISTQIAIHRLYGGVVPEIASRHHLTNINAVVEEALDAAGMRLEEVDAVAVTCGPGLVGALVIGIATAKAIAFAAGRPLIAVHHIQGHISANFLEHPDLEPPVMALVVSGGHTNIVEVTDYNSCRVLGSTRDDAVGEAYDKVARVLGLGYPGGPLMDKLAACASPDHIEFKRVFLEKDSLDFSFSGIKTAVLNYVHNEKQKGNIISAAGYEGDFDASRPELVRAAQVAAGFQEAVLDVIVTKAVGAARTLGKTGLVVAGGVASNSRLRAKLDQACRKAGLKLYYPSPVLCTDNAAMIGAAAYYKYIEGDFAPAELDAYPGLAL